MVVRNLRNSMARWRRCRAVMTVPALMSKAANRLVVPERT
jgi:hypothetical protein